MKRTRYDNEAVREATTVEAVSPKFKKRRQFDGKSRSPRRILPDFSGFFPLFYRADVPAKHFSRFV